MPQTRIGISGWTYGPWRGVFYPKDLPQKRELEYASRQFNSIEINGSFYSLQKPGSYDAWYDATPKDFVFSLKGGRFITHMRRLKDVEIPLANFFASGLLKLKEKLGPILWQLPPNFLFDEERFANFFPLLPGDTAAMARLASKHEAKLKGRTWAKADANRRVRHAIEVRHHSFNDKRFIALCRRHRIAIVVADTAGKWPLIEEFTSDFMYARLHGEEELYVSGYTDEALARWVKKIQGWRGTGRDVYVYFDNDVKVRSPADAMSLAARLAGRVPSEYTADDGPPPAPSRRRRVAAANAAGAAGRMSHRRNAAKRDR
jgi:uncharacterized protein YecE (DUF72 family)